MKRAIREKIIEEAEAAAAAVSDGNRNHSTNINNLSNSNQFRGGSNNLNSADKNQPILHNFKQKHLNNENRMNDRTIRFDLKKSQNFKAFSLI